MKSIKLSLVCFLAFALSACNSLELSERDANKAFFKNIEKNWSGNLLVSNGSIPYTMHITGTHVDFINTSEFHDANVIIEAQFKIDQEGYYADSPVQITLGSHINIDKSDASVYLTDIFAKEVKFKTLYKSYADDLNLPVKESVSNISDEYLRTAYILSFKEEKNEIDNHMSQSDQGGYKLIKEINRDRLEIKFVN